MRLGLGGARGSGPSLPENGNDLDAAYERTLAFIENSPAEIPGYNQPVIQQGQVELFLYLILKSIDFIFLANRIRKSYEESEGIERNCEAKTTEERCGGAEGDSRGSSSRCDW